MVNISKIAGLATEAFSAVRKMPKAGQAGLAGLFGAGLLTGSLINCDGFEKQANTTPEKPKTEVKADTAKVTKPEVKEEKFNYVPPKVGEDGIAKADTTYYAGTNITYRIAYKDSTNAIVHDTYFDKNGNFKEFYVVNPKDNREFNHYDKKGELVSSQRRREDGGISYLRKDRESGYTLKDIYDKNDRIIQHEYARLNDYSTEDRKIYDLIISRYTRNTDGTITKNTYRNGTLESQETKDKNNKVIKEKKYDRNEKLEYTVVPKYDKDGDIVKRDTIRNN